MSPLGAPRELRPGGPPRPVAAGRTGGRHRRPALPAAESVQHVVHVVFPAQALKEGDEVQQLCVRHVIEPGLHGHLEDSVWSGQQNCTWCGMGQLLARMDPRTVSLFLGKEDRYLKTIIIIIWFSHPS